MKNNFDISTNGVNLKLNCFYDTDLAQMDFTDNFQRIGNREKKFYFTDYEQNPEFEGFHEVTNKRKFVNALFAFDPDYMKRYYTKKDLLAWSSDELISEFEEHYNLVDFDGITDRYNCVTATGHSQGDYIEAYFPKNQTWLTSKLLENMAFGSPIYCRLEIDSDEYCLDEGLKDFYEWDIDQVLSYAKETINHPKKEYILNWLEKNLPEYPEYL